MAPYLHKFSAVVNLDAISERFTFFFWCKFSIIKKYAGTATSNRVILDKFGEQPKHQSSNKSTIYDVQLALFWCKKGEVS